MKRFAAILLAGILSLAVAIPSFAAVNTNADFWAVDSMEYAYEEGLITEAELQKATSPMSREEFCGVIMHFLQAVTGIERTATQASPFSDCDDPMVIAAYEAGIIGGVEPGRFAPDQTLTREQMAIMIARTLKVCSFDLMEGAKEHPFTDTKTLYDSSNDYIDELYGVGIISGYDDGTFGPFRKMTVQEAVISFVRAYRFIMTGSADEIVSALAEEDPVREEPVAAVPEEMDMTVVTVDGKEISLGMTAEELEEIWGEPDRIDETLYSLDRYVYVNDYIDYFFATIEKGKVVEIFVPGAAFEYLGMNGKGTTADIRELNYVSAVEHSGVIKSEEAEARIPLDYRGNISGLILQTADFVENKNPMSLLHLTLQEDLEAELADIIQVRRLVEEEELLMVDGQLSSIAREHSADMVKNNYFDYNSLDGTTPFGRFMERGKTFGAASEVIVRQRGDVVNVYQEWLRTAAKYTGLMDVTMAEMGVGVAGKSKILYVTVDLCG